MPRKPVDQVNAGRSFFADQLPGIDFAYFAPLWHLFTIGHLISTDLDNVTRKLGCSFADLSLLGTLAIDERKAVRATDLASALHVSNAVISARAVRLERDGLIVRTRSGQDRRAFHLELTARGQSLLAQAIPMIAEEAKIVRFVTQLDPADRLALSRILGHLHQQFDREFVGGPYTVD